MSRHHNLNLMTFGLISTASFFISSAQAANTTITVNTTNPAGSTINSTGTYTITGTYKALRLQTMGHLTMQFQHRVI